MKRKGWIDIHNRDYFEDFMEAKISETRWDDNPLDALKECLTNYRNYKESERIMRRLEKKGVKKDGKE